MKTVKSLLKFLFVVVVVVSMCTPAFAYGPLKPIPGQFIVVFKDASIQPGIKAKVMATGRDAKVSAFLIKSKASLNKINLFHAKHKIKDSAVIHRFGNVISGFSAKLADNEVAALRKNADVAGVYQDFEIALGPVTPESTPAPSAQGAVTCAVTTAGGPVDGSQKATWIWILDTGINLAHPDLNVQTNPAFAQSFITGQTVEDGNGHGTHCAGIAAAKNNGIGVTGVSAGAKVVPVKVLANSGTGSFSALLAGLNHVAAHDIPGDVVSMSLGAYPINNCTTVMPALTAAIQNLGNAGTYVVMAAGNDGVCAGAGSNLPGCINGNKVFTIGAINCDKTRAGYSNFGANVVDWVAVGTSVYSTYKNGGYATLSGTSMATPVVAGIIHARGGAPVSGGNANCCGANYKIAKR